MQLLYEAVEAGVRLALRERREGGGVGDDWEQGTLHVFSHTSHHLEIQEIL